MILAASNTLTIFRPREKVLGRNNFQRNRKQKIVDADYISAYAVHLTKERTKRDPEALAPLCALGWDTTMWFSLLAML